jgi:uncharacterized protein DUF2585
MDLDRAQRGKLVAAIVTFAVLPLMALVLWAEGRMFLCACGEFRFWVGDTCSSSNSQQLFDPYSFTHLLHGFLLFWLIALVFKWRATTNTRTQTDTGAWQLALAIALEALWEILENTRFVIDHYRTETAALGYTGDTIVNSFGDLACAFAGFLLARAVGLKWSLVVFVLIELILALWIHDSLVLQIVMLIRPVQTIKLWQMCS